jgi:CBS domain-containing protein
MPPSDTLVTPADEINPLLTAADIMTPSPRTCSNFSTVLEAVLIFRDADCGLVPVLEDGKPVGVLTDRDVALALIDHGAGLPSMSVAEVMTRGIASISPDAKLDEVKAAFGEHGGIRRLLVVDGGGDLLGVVSWSDLAAHASARGIGELVKRAIEGT